jgi:hypothetical protein
LCDEKMVGWDGMAMRLKAYEFEGGRKGEEK